MELTLAVAGQPTFTSTKRLLAWFGAAPRLTEPAIWVILTGTRWPPIVRGGLKMIKLLLFKSDQLSPNCQITWQKIFNS